MSPQRIGKLLSEGFYDKLRKPAGSASFGTAQPLTDGFFPWNYNMIVKGTQSFTLPPKKFSNLPFNPIAVHSLTLSSYRYAKTSMAERVIDSVNLAMPKRDPVTFVRKKPLIFPRFM